MSNLHKGTVASPSPQSWRSFAVPMFAGQFDTRIDSEEDYLTSTLGALWGVPPTNRPKAKAPAMIPSIYSEYDARNHKVQQQHGRFVALTGDIDEGNVPIARVIDLTRQIFGPDAAIFIYSTSSATADDKRWRIIVPLEQPVPFDRWNEAQEAFFRFMAANDVVMDTALARAAQPVYLPNIPADKRDEEGTPLFYETYAEGEKGVPL